MLMHGNFRISILLPHKERLIFLCLYNYIWNLKIYSYAIHPKLHTGICVSIINDTYRSLAANLGAAAIYTLEDLNSTELPLDSVRIIYIEGFFITHSLDVAKEVVKRTQGKNIVIAFNLCGTYIFKVTMNYNFFLNNQQYEIK